MMRITRRATLEHAALCGWRPARLARVIGVHPQSAGRVVLMYDAELSAGWRCKLAQRRVLNRILAHHLDEPRWNQMAIPLAIFHELRKAGHDVEFRDTKGSKWEINITCNGMQVLIERMHYRANKRGWLGTQRRVRRPDVSDWKRNVVRALVMPDGTIAVYFPETHRGRQISLPLIGKGRKYIRPDLHFQRNLVPSPEG